MRLLLVALLGSLLATLSAARAPGPPPGILGWSHSGMITLMNIFEHPEAYAGNDKDANVLEVEHLIRALKAEGKKFEYKIY